MLSEQWTSARILKQLMPKKKKRFEVFWAVAWEKTLVRHDLPLSLILCSSLSLCWWLLFSLFSGVFFISFSCCSSQDIRLFNLCLLLFSFTFLSPYSAFLASFLTFLRLFSRLALRLLLLSFFGRSVSFFPVYFHSNPFSTNLDYNNFLWLTKL